MSRIFISYKRVDKDKVFRIKNKIESALGEKCWIDLDGIESDAQFKNVIIKAINECEIVLFMYSKAHSKIVDFEKDWTIRELNFAQTKNKRIVFINLDGSPMTDAFAFDYGTKQQVNGTVQQDLIHLNNDLLNWLGISNTQQSLKTSGNAISSQSKSKLLRLQSYIKSHKGYIMVGAIMAVLCYIIILSSKKQPFPPIVTDSISHDSKNDTNNASVRHFKYRGIPIDKSIQDFADKLYPQGFVLQSKDYDNHRYTFYKEEERTKLIVEWDEVSGNVFLVYDIMVGTSPGTVTPFSMADDGWGKVGRFDESHDCVDGGNGLIIFTDGDWDGNECLIFVDSINSNGYDLVNI